MLLPASLVTDIGHCKVQFSSLYLEKVVTEGGLTEIHDQCKQNVSFPLLSVVAALAVNSGESAAVWVF